MWVAATFAEKSQNLEQVFRVMGVINELYKDTVVVRLSLFPSWGFFYQDTD